MQRARNVVLAFVLCLFALPLAARELHWKSLDVNARLDAEGRLHVVERHHYVFNGDWNGGERKFYVGTVQKLDLQTVTRIGPAGERIALVKGDLENVDEYDWAENNTLRWRSRLPSDPPFENTEIVYELDYILSNILLVDEEDGERRFMLDHDFAFAERDGMIEQFNLALDFDPVWEPIGESRRTWSATSLAPGVSFPLDIYLRYNGEGFPAGVVQPAAKGPRRAIFAGVLAVIAALLAAFWSGERSRGRFDREETGPIDEAWLKKNVFFAPPEVIGALWDSSTDASEVAALLARLAQEKKIETKVVSKGLIFKRPQLEMTLLVDRSQFRSMERQLIDAFFFDGDTTDTERIRSHYRSSGFNPVSKIREPLEETIDKEASWKPVKRPRNWWLDIALVIAAYGLFATLIVLGGSGLVIGIVLAFVGIFVLVFGSVLAHSSRTAIGQLPVYAFFFTLPTLVQLILLALFAEFASFPVAAVTVAMAAVAILFLYWFVIGFAPSTEAPARLAVRKRLLAAREFFRRELRKPDPALRDEWFPYIMAFGLGANVDRWFSAYGGAARSMSSGSSFGSSGSSSTSVGGQGGPGGSWSGGGTSFGGAGATGAWAVAAGGLASGVAAPGSSSGGGGGGGSSSGGGGGGGW